MVCEHSLDFFPSLLFGTPTVRSFRECSCWDLACADANRFSEIEDVIRWIAVGVHFDYGAFLVHCFQQLAFFVLESFEPRSQMNFILRQEILKEAIQLNHSIACLLLLVLENTVSCLVEGLINLAQAHVFISCIDVWKYDWYDVFSEMRFSVDLFSLESSLSYFHVVVV